MKYQIALVVFGLAGVLTSVTSSVAKVEEGIWRDLEKSVLINVKVTFRKSDTAAAFDRFYSLKLKSREAILTTQHAILKDHADAVQSDVTSMLNKAASKRHYLDQLWISNELIVRDVDRETVEKLRDHRDVESLIAEEFFQLEKTVEGHSYDVRDYNNTILDQWNIENIGANLVWNKTMGENIVIGSIDTGALHTHISLFPTYRGTDDGSHEYNWRAPSTNTSTPSDNVGHGTHCIGTHSGINGIGVAPNSRWISCKGCQTTSCSSFDLESCGNFMACPTNTTGGAALCTKAPKIVSNSWTFGKGKQTWYNSILTAWRNAGINGVFAIGNSGTACKTVESPADQPLAFGVGSITNTNTLSYFSSVGPGPANAYKPNVVAPGTSITSASNGSNTTFAVMSGTSMATPHVSGLLALLRSAFPNLTPEEAQNKVTAGAVAHSSTGSRICDGIRENIRPNYHVGYGRINATNTLAP